ncbi:hypothetical protein TKWG_24945 [Advenella kashmirensis WT001]|uniref:Uncharacterized protein n=1 Tax=Advenella kashmirensis (strain DSM 17095 / LMG 22695 / WT001) TaxID=1036672 RepID=I3UHP6_ADVKW|nr:hypothetical protein TKWG_24945 [Advenella kashmirensis WT001]
MLTQCGAMVQALGGRYRISSGSAGVLLIAVGVLGMLLVGRQRHQTLIAPGPACGQFCFRQVGPAGRCDAVYQLA